MGPNPGDQCGCFAVIIARKIPEVRKAVAEARAEGAVVGLVPTMGAFHQGHLSLMRRAREETAFLAVSLFVNPTQFGPSEDFQDYPRDFEKDRRLAEDVGVDLLFAPTTEEMYPPEYETYVIAHRLTEHLCGLSRPGFFNGVCTVVAKLLNIVRPDVAYFGEKDYQQSLVVRQMVADLNMGIEVRVCPIVREADGLAMSSRNWYLSPAERKQALRLHESLQLAQRLVQAGETDCSKILHRMHKRIQASPDVRIDYVEIVHPKTLEKLGTLEGEARALLAVWIGKTRLIDNARLGGKKGSEE